MRLKELRKLLGEHGEACTGCLEKADFVARAVELRGKKRTILGYEL